MKNTFPEFARKTAEEHRKIWDNSLVIFDTNVLLSLYYYSPETRKSIIEMMKRLKSRLWMPYQVGKEFYMGRVSIIQKLETLPNNIIKDFDNLLESIKKHGYDPTKSVICINEKNCVLDGQHRSCALLSVKGGEYEIPVVRVSRK